MNFRINTIAILLLILILNSCSTTKINKNKIISSGEIIFIEYYDLTKAKATENDQTQIKFIDSLMKINFAKDSIKSNFNKTQKDSIAKLKDYVLKTFTELNSQELKDTTKIKFEIFKDYYFIPESHKSIPENFIGEPNFNDLKQNFLTIGKKIYRDSLKKCFTGRDKDCRLKRQNNIEYLNISNYNIEYFKGVNKDINGYEAFKVQISDKLNNKVIYDLYVTDKINLNYNPLLNIKSINDKGYFILEKIFYGNSTKISTVNNIEFYIK